MIVRFASTLALAAFAASLATTPILAQSAVDPARVLAGKGGHGPGDRFADRTARLGSIMGPMKAVPLNIPTKPAFSRALHREADAGAGLR